MPITPIKAKPNIPKISKTGKSKTENYHLIMKNLKSEKKTERPDYL